MSMKYIEEKSRSGVCHKKFTSDFGMKILSKFGWNEGEGLGKNKTGITDVVQIKRREENMGLGNEAKQANWGDKWWEDSYNDILKSMKPTTKPKDDEDISSDETGPEPAKSKKAKSKNKKEKISKEVLFLKKKRKITFISL